MNNLPNEVLIPIFKYLHLQQKLECMLICHKFAQILSVGYLFETINIGRKGYNRSILEKRRNAVIDRAKNEPRYGKKCKRLLIDTGIDDNLNIENLAATFPNIYFFHISQNLIDIPPAEHTQVDPFEGWKNNLETLYVNSRSMVSPKNILNQGVFSRLSIINFKVNNRLPTRSVTCDIFPVLCNAPALTTLRISDCLMSITNLEILHKNAPKLTSLTIENGIF
jgi:hypothetical protein